MPTFSSKCRIDERKHRERSLRQKAKLRPPAQTTRRRNSRQANESGPEASSQGKKRPLDADDEVVELDHDETAGPPRKKKKKKNKSKDRSKGGTPTPETQDDGVCGNDSMARPEVVAEEPVPTPATSGTLTEGTKVPKKKKKKSAELERFQLEQRETKAKEMARAKHRRLQRDQDFKAL